MIEKWKQVTIRNINNVYFVSNKGRIRSHCYNKETGRILKAHKYKNGLETVTLFIGRKKKTFYIHKLVAIHFLPNPEKHRIVAHKNGKIHDNNASNLKWVSKDEFVKTLSRHYGPLFEATVKRYHGSVANYQNKVSSGLYKVCPRCRALRLKNQFVFKMCNRCYHIWLKWYINNRLKKVWKSQHLSRQTA